MFIFTIHFVDGNYMFKVNNRNTRIRFEMCSKLTIKRPERHCVILVPLLLTFSICQSLLYFNPYSIFQAFCTAWRLFQCRASSGPYFSVFGLNTNTCYIDFCIQIESGKIKTRRNYVFGYFSHNARVYFEKNSKNEIIIKLSLGHIWIGRISIYPLFIQKGFHKWEDIKHNNLETCDAVICLTERSSPKLTD